MPRSSFPRFLIGEKTLNGSSIKVTSPAAAAGPSPAHSLFQLEVYFSTIFPATECECATAANKFHTRMLLASPSLSPSIPLPAAETLPGGLFNSSIRMNTFVWLARDERRRK